MCLQQAKCARVRTRALLANLRSKKGKYNMKKTTFNISFDEDKAGALLETEQRYRKKGGKSSLLFRLKSG